MKKLYLFLVFVLLFGSSSGVYAQSLLQSRTGTSAAANQTLNTQTEEARISDLKQRAQTEITRRINFLTELLTKIDKIKKLTDEDKASLKSQMQTQIDSLNVLQTKINSDTDLVTLRTDVKSIITGYYIFAFFRVKIELLFAADKLSVTTNTLTMIYNKLQTRINDAQSQGKDVSELNILLSDMSAKINDAKAEYLASETQLNTLNPQGFPGNKSTLLSVRSKLKLGAQDLRAAYQDAVKIRQGLEDVKGNLRVKTGTGSATEKTPQGI